MIEAAKVRLFPAGADGSATVTSADTDWDKAVEGEIIGIAVDLVTQPNTVDVTVKHPNASASNIWAASNMSADVFVVPSVFGVSNANVALTSDVTPQHYVAFGYPSVVVAQGDAGAAKYVDVVVFFRRR